MGWMRFFRRARWNEERERELQTYLETETEENIARGMTPDEARYAARRKLGNPTQIREEIYRMNSLTFIESLWQDVHCGLGVRLCFCGRIAAGSQAVDGTNGLAVVAPVQAVAERLPVLGREHPGRLEEPGQAAAGVQLSPTDECPGGARR